MSPAESALLESLNALESAAAGQGGTRPAPSDILALLSRIDQLAEQLPPETSAELRHFLQRKSYEKARLHLLGRQSENARGSCGH